MTSEDMGNTATSHAQSHAQRRRSSRLQRQEDSAQRDDVPPAQPVPGEDDPEYVPEHIWVASESASDDEVDMTDEDEDDSDEDEDEGEGRGRIYIPIMGGLRVARRSMSERNATLSKLERVPKEPPPAEESVNQIVSSATACENPRHRNRVRQARGKGRSKAAPPCRRASTLRMLQEREAGMLGGTACAMSAPQRCHLGAFVYQPAVPVHCIDTMHSRAYIGQFSGDGDVFIAAYQHDRRIRIYETENDWRLRKDVHARNLRWTVTDTCLSPDQRFLLYSSITPTVHMVNMAASGTVESEANVTDIHEALHFDVLEEDSDDYFQRGFGIWSLSWAASGAEVVAGTGDDSLYLYNMDRQKTTLRIKGHDDDVNAVAFMDDSSNLIASGSDDTLLKVWDRRALRGTRPAGVLIGHTEGITHLDPKNDGRYLLSNCKDQTARLWDIRKMYTSNQHHRLPPAKIPKLGDWDYRWADFPARGYIVPHPHDVSVQTFRGHSVLQTLIRAYFSPAHSTGQRFVYTGSADGTPRIFDIVTGKPAQELRYHKEIVRDLSWHPYLPMMVTSAFDGSVVQWDPRQSVDEEAGRGVCTKRRRQLPEPGEDRLEDFY